jgi:hypothetical protein
MRNVVFIQAEEDAGQGGMCIGPGKVEPADRRRLLRDRDQCLQFAQQQETGILAPALASQPVRLAARIAGTVEMRSGEADRARWARVAATVVRRRWGIGANHAETLSYPPPPVHRPEPQNNGPAMLRDWPCDLPRNRARYPLKSRGRCLI